MQLKLRVLHCSLLSWIILLWVCFSIYFWLSEDCSMTLELLIGFGILLFHLKYKNEKKNHHFFLAVKLLWSHRLLQQLSLTNDYRTGSSKFFEGSGTLSTVKIFSFFSLSHLYPSFSIHKAIKYSWIEWLPFGSQSCWHTLAHQVFSHLRWLAGTPRPTPLQCIETNMIWC